MGKTHNFAAALLKVPFSVFTNTTRTILSAPGYVSTIRPSDHLSGGRFFSFRTTKSPTLTLTPPGNFWCVDLIHPNTPCTSGPRSVEPFSSNFVPIESTILNVTDV